jgi:hypothetical protein
MNRAMLYLLTLIQGLQAARADFDQVVEQLHATGLERLTEALQPVFDQATEMATELTAAQDALDTAAWRATLIEEVRDAVIAEIAAQELYIKAGQGTQGITLHAGAGLPGAGLGADGDIYVQGG